MKQNDQTDTPVNDQTTFTFTQCIPKEVLDEIDGDHGYESFDDKIHNSSNPSCRGEYSTTETAVHFDQTSEEKHTREQFEEQMGIGHQTKSKTGYIRATPSQIETQNSRRFHSDKQITQETLRPNQNVLYYQNPLYYVQSLNTFHANLIKLKQPQNNFHAQQQNVLIINPTRVNQSHGTAGISGPTVNFNNLEEKTTLKQFLVEMQGQSVAFVKTHKGSIHMQKLLDRATSTDVDYFLNNFPLKEIMNDNYGNYFVQKMIQCCKPEQRLTILKMIVPNFVEIAYNISGTHSIQSLIQLMSQSEEFALLQFLIEPYILELSCNQNSSHIIQKIITCFEEKNRMYITIFIIENFANMCLNPHSICVIKKFMNVNINTPIRHLLIKNLEMNALLIVQDPFGNYAVQHAFELWGPALCCNLIRIVLENIILLSVQKFSSNVIEKSIQICSNHLFDSVVSTIFLNETNFLFLFRSKFGLFVLQKTVTSMSSKQKQKVLMFLKKKVKLEIGLEKCKLNIMLETLQKDK